MPCFSPIAAFQPIAGGPLSFGGREPKDHREIKIPCGQCRGCRLERARQWAIRCTHEGQLHRQNCFITLTYDDNNLPQFGSLHKPDLQKFFKRLRKNVGPFRYYACGEYGERTNRAHYHACIFGLDFIDKKPLKKSGDHTLYTSETLTKTWGHGNASIGELTFQTAAYTATYVMKKQLGEGGHGYVRIDEQTGEIIKLVQPFACMSLRPAIAAGWLRKYSMDVYGHDKDAVRIQGRSQKPPKYYDNYLKATDEDRYAAIKLLRYEASEGLTDQELRARADIAHARNKLKTEI